MIHSRYVIYLYLSSLFILITGFTISVSVDYPVNLLFEDPAKHRRLLGLFTYIGCLLWGFNAAICLFSSMLLRNSEDKALSFFIAIGGILSLILLFDDLFLFHEFMQSNFKSIGENGVFAIYGIAIATYLIFFRSIIFSTDFILLGLALLFFSISLTIDVIIGPWLWRLGTWFIIVEDIPKFLGIVSWFGYFLKVCYLSVNSDHQPQSSP